MDVARRDPSQTWRARANAVLAVEALHATGTPLSLAAGDVLRMIKQHTGRKPGVPGRTLLIWRREFSVGRMNDEAKELFDLGRNLIEALRSAQALRGARALRQFADERAQAAGKVDGVFGPPPNTP